MKDKLSAWFDTLRPLMNERRLADDLVEGRLDEHGVMRFYLNGKEVVLTVKENEHLKLIGFAKTLDQQGGIIIDTEMPK